MFIVSLFTTICPRQTSLGLVRRLQELFYQGDIRNPELIGIGVRPPGVEPGSSVPQTLILSIELWAQRRSYFIMPGVKWN
jgi:hypothetical protein